MKKMFILSFILVFFSMTSMAFAGRASAAESGTETVVMLTQEEAAREDIPRETSSSHTVCSSGSCLVAPESLSLVETKYATGPQIKIVEPSPETEHKSPIKLIIDFIPKGDAQVDLESFKLECLKLITINITSRVIQYVKPEGIKIEKADFPPGEYKLRITLKDTKDGITQQVYYVKIMK